MNTLANVIPAPTTPNDADPVTAEIVRSALKSTATQMARVLLRTAFSPVIYDMMDFAIAVYDPQMRLMAPAINGIPVFMGTLSFCIEAAVSAVGGAEALEPGDVIIYNEPYGTGSHAQDIAIVIPAFHEGTLIGYIANKAHSLDIGAKDPYCTDTTDIFQEGLVLPGVKLYRRGERSEDVFRIIVANSRMPRAIAGDLDAQVASGRVGTQLLEELLVQHGPEVFWSSIERMYRHGEDMMRRFIEGIPDGRYTATGHMDNNGLDDRPIEFEITLEVKGSSLRIDCRNAPDAQAGPVNCPMPGIVAASRVAVCMIAGFPEAPNEGHFRPIEVMTRPGSIFHPVPPQPCFIYGKLVSSLIEAIIQAFSTAIDGLVPSGSNGDICPVQIWGGGDGNHDPWITGTSLPSGQGAHSASDGSILYIPAIAFSTVIPMEIQEAKTPVLFERAEITPDTGGPGRFRGSVGWQRRFKLLEDGRMLSTIERTKVPSWGQRGGLSGVPNRLTIIDPEGRSRSCGKATGVPLGRGTIVQIDVGGGGGYGPPEEREPARVLDDLREGYISEAHAKAYYPQAFGHEAGTAGALGK